MTASGMPMPPIALEAMITSGTIPCCSNANHVPVRPQPLCTSSTISGTSSSRVIRRTACMKSVGAGLAQLQGSVDGVRAGGPAELDLRALAHLRGQLRELCRGELVLDLGRQVERVTQERELLLDCLHHLGMAVTEGHRARAGQE